MSRHNDTVSLQQMLVHAREAVAMVKDCTREQLDNERVLSLALVQLVQIIGESANRVSDPRRQQHAEIPWSQIVALRNRLIHGYDTINFDILWKILIEDLPLLVASLEKILSYPES